MQAPLPPPLPGASANPPPVPPNEPQHGLPPPLPGLPPSLAVPPLPSIPAPPKVPVLPVASAATVQAELDVPPLSTDDLFSLPPVVPPLPSAPISPLPTPPVSPAPPVPPSVAPGVPPEASPQHTKPKWLWGALLLLLLLAGAIAAYFYTRESAAPAPNVEPQVAPAASAIPSEKPKPAPVPVPEASPVAEPSSDIEPDRVNVPDAKEPLLATPKSNDSKPEASKEPVRPPVPAAAPATQETKQAPQKAAPPQPSVSKGPILLDGAFYLFGNSIRPARNYQMAYTVLNVGVPADDPLAGQVKSQVFRVLVDCKNSKWGFDQRNYHAKPFGEGKLLSEKIWAISEVKFKPFRDSVQDQRLKELLCR